MSSRFHAVESPWEVDPNIGVLQSMVETRDFDTMEIECVVAVRYLRDGHKVSGKILLKTSSVVYFQRRLWYSERLPLDPEIADLQEFSWTRRLMDEYHAEGDINKVFKEEEDEWSRTGLCPNPRFFTVEPSWLPPSIINLLAGKKHYLIVDDTTVTEFVAYDVHWEEKEPANS